MILGKILGREDIKVSLDRVLHIREIPGKEVSQVMLDTEVSRVIPGKQGIRVAVNLADFRSFRRAGRRSCTTQSKTVLLLRSRNQGSSGSKWPRGRPSGIRRRDRRRSSGKKHLQGVSTCAALFFHGKAQVEEPRRETLARCVYMYADLCF